MIDLRNKVWGLNKENANLRASISEARGQLEELLGRGAQEAEARGQLEELLGRGAQEAEWRKTVAEKDAQVAPSDRVKKAERGRLMYMWALLACVCFTVVMMVSR